MKWLFPIQPNKIWRQPVRLLEDPNRTRSLGLEIPVGLLLVARRVAGRRPRAGMDKKGDLSRTAKRMASTGSSEENHYHRSKGTILQGR